MFLATSLESTLCLNASNHPSIPPEGLVLEACTPREVTPEQAEYLATLGIPLIETVSIHPKSSRATAPKE